MFFYPVGDQFNPLFPIGIAAKYPTSACDAINCSRVLAAHNGLDYLNRVRRRNTVHVTQANMC